MAAGSAPSLGAPTRPLSFSPLPGHPCDPLPVPPHLPLGRVCGKNSAVAAGSSAPWDAPRAARAARPGRAGAGRGDHRAGERTCASAPTQGRPGGPSVGHGWPHAAGGGGVPAAPAARLQLVSLFLSRGFPAEVTGSTPGPRCRCGSPPCQLGRFPVQKNQTGSGLR